METLPPFRCTVRLGPALGLVAFGLLAACESANDRLETLSEAVPLTSDPGDEVHPSFSPDGTRLAFAWRKENEDNYDIYAKVIRSGSERRLTSHPADDYGPAWSPDGRWIAFLRDLAPNKCDVLLTPPDGSSIQELAEISSGGIHSGLAWSPDAKHLVVSHQESSNEPPALFLLDVGSGEKTRLTHPSDRAMSGDADPAVSPDGRRIVFLRMGDGPVGELYLLDLSETLEPVGTPRPLTSAGQLALGPVWTPDGQEIIFTLATGMYRSSLWRVQASGGEPRRLALDGNGVSPAISRQGRRLAYAKPRRDADIWRLDLRDRAKPPVRLISSPEWETHAQYSADGGKIAFRSDRSGRSQIWVCNQDGSNPVKLTAFDGPAVGQPVWSPDSETIAFVSRSTENADVYVISSAGGEPRRVTTDPAVDIRPSWSPDGDWIYFLSFRSGDGEIWKTPFRGGEPVRITHGGALQPVPSPDGMTLYYTRFTSGAVSLWKVPVEGGEAVQVANALLNRGSFTVTRQGVYFVPEPDAEGLHHLQLIDRESGQIRPITALPEGDFLRFSVSPDGRYLLYRRAYEATSDLMLVENFR